MFNLKIVVLLILVVSFAATQDLQQVSASWEGLLKVGDTQLTLIFHLTEEAGGTWHAVMDSPDQGVKGIPCNAVQIKDQTLTIMVSAIGGQFEGVFSADRKSIAGKWMQGGQSFDLLLEPQVRGKKQQPELPDEEFQAIKGFWQGTLAISAVELRLIFRIGKQEDGSLKAFLDSPDQGARDIVVSSLEVDGMKVIFHVAAVGGRYEGQLKTANEMEGRWFQSGQSWPLQLHRVEEIPKTIRPQHPQKPFLYQEEEVTFVNKPAEITLAGTLTYPEGSGPFAAAVLISGSGPQDRDETVFEHKPFLVVADHLTRNGLAVLRFDDRGVGKSTGKFASATSADFAGDVQAAVEFLKTRPEIDPARIGLIGHSEGGIIAPMVAAKDNSIAFIVLIAGPGLPGDELLLLQSSYILQASGVSADMVQLLNTYNRQIYDIVINEPVDSLARKVLQQQSTNFWQNLQEKQKIELQDMGVQPEQIDMTINQILSPWFRFFIAYDPAQDLREVRCPILAVIGEKDLQVPPKENISRLKQIFQENGHHNFQLQELPGLNHLLQTADTGLPAEYSKIEETMAPAALELISDWIRNLFDLN